MPRLPPHGRRVDLGFMAVRRLKHWCGAAVVSGGGSQVSLPAKPCLCRAAWLGTVRHL